MADSSVTGKIERLTHDAREEQRLQTLPAALGSRTWPTPSETADRRTGTSAIRSPRARRAIDIKSTDTRYRARLAWSMYTIQLLTMQEVGDRLGVTRQRAHQLIHVVEPTLDGRLVEQRRRLSRDH